MGKEIRITIHGGKEDIQTALRALIHNASDEELREMVAQLSLGKLIRLAQLIHGSMYRLLKTHC